MEQEQQATVCAECNTQPHPDAANVGHCALVLVSFHILCGQQLTVKNASKVLPFLSRLLLLISPCSFKNESIQMIVSTLKTL